MEFNYYLPVNLVFGRGKSELIGEKAAFLGKRAFIVTGGSSTKRSGLLSRVQEQLQAKGVEHVLFDKVMPNPTTTLVYEGAEVANSEGCDVVIALGGGSSMDAAKGIAFQAVNGGDINEYIFARKTSDLALPVIAVPTTCGTGSEGNGFAVMTNPETMDKKSLRCNAIVPKVSIIDPLLMTTMPRNVLASVGFDALMHNLEGYISRIGQPMTDIQSYEGVRLAAVSLRKVYYNPEDLDALERLCWASTLGGMVINTAGVTALHGMEHPVSGLKDAVHGGGLAALAPAVLKESLRGAPDKFAVLSRLLGGNNENDFIAKIEELLQELNLTTSLGKLGITEADVDWLAENTMKISAAALTNNPVVFGIEDVKRVFRMAL